MEKGLQHRINAGGVAIADQIPFFIDQFGEVASSWKPDDTRVTFADFAISERIFAELRRSFQRDTFCSEESNPGDEIIALENRWTWMLDPIDGTNNYFLGLPSCAIALALLDRGTPVYGWVYDFARRAILHGGPDLGIWRDRRRLQPARRPLSRHSVFALHFPLSPTLADQLAPLLTGYRVRSLGSAALNLTYAALGLVDGCFEHKAKVWDMAAGWALAKGAGLEVDDLTDEGIFPLTEFHANMPVLRYQSGSPEALELLRELLG